VLAVGFYTNKMSRIVGLPNSNRNRVFNMFMKTRYIRLLSGDRAVFVTLTPISERHV